MEENLAAGVSDGYVPVDAGFPGLGGAQTTFPGRIPAFGGGRYVCNNVGCEKDFPTVTDKLHHMRICGKGTKRTRVF